MLGPLPKRFYRASGLVLLLGVVACGYHVVGRGGSSLGHWKTVAVPVFVNRTLQYRIEQRFTQAVVRELLTRSAWKIVPEPTAADAVLYGEIVAVDISPLLFDSATGRATTMLITVQARVRLQDQKTHRLVYENDHFLLRDQAEVSTDPRSFFSEEDPAVDRIARDFATRLVAALLEGR